MSDLKVEYNFLGKCGVKVSNICLGTMTFGHNEKWELTKRQLSEEDSHRIMDVFASHGGNFIDTADIYSLGKTEEVVGNWLSKQDRKRFILATKVCCPYDASDVNSIGLSRRHIVESCERSLERLGTHYIDLYQSHMWDAGTPLDETLRTFDDLIRCGKVRYYGASNMCGWQLQKTVCRLEAMGLNSCVTLQEQYSLLCRQSEFDEFVVCRNEGVAVLPWCPLKGGLLTGKYKRHVDPDPNTSRLGVKVNYESDHLPALSEYNNDETFWSLVGSLKEISETHGKSVSQVALRWLLQKDAVASVVTGVTSVQQLEDNMGAASGWKLSDEEMARLDEVSMPLKLYPFKLIDLFNEGRYNPFNAGH